MNYKLLKNLTLSSYALSLLVLNDVNAAAAYAVGSDTMVTTIKSLGKDGGEPTYLGMRI